MTASTIGETALLEYIYSGQELKDRMSQVGFIDDDFITAIEQRARGDVIGLDRAHGLVSGAAPISPQILEFFASLDITIWEVYGQSEGTGPTTTTYEGNTRYGTVGKAIPGCEVKLDEYGEIIAKGRNVFPGYYKDPEKTAQTFREFGGRVWSVPGDWATVADDGTITLLGRGSVSINTGGEKVFPEEVEEALKAHPDIIDALVVGVPDETWGNRVVAVGTTVVRALETMAGTDGLVHPGEGWTRLVIGPEREIRVVDGMLTGLHEPPTPVRVAQIGSPARPVQPPSSSSPGAVSAIRAWWCGSLSRTSSSRWGRRS